MEELLLKIEDGTDTEDMHKILKVREIASYSSFDIFTVWHGDNASGCDQVRVKYWQGRVDYISNVPKDVFIEEAPLEFVSSKK